MRSIDRKHQVGGILQSFKRIVIFSSQGHENFMEGFPYELELDNLASAAISLQVPIWNL